MPLFNFSLLARDVGIDIGTVNTLIARRNEGVVLRESSIVAVDKEKRIVAVGEDAQIMLGRAPGDLRVVQPLQDGVVVDYRLCEAMLHHFLEKAMGRNRIGVRAVLCVPGCVTNVEKRALEDAARNAGARAAFMIDEPVAAAIGAGLPVDAPFGSMIVDIGGGTTDAAVLALGGVVLKRSVRAGGTHIDAAIMQYIQNTYGIIIGARTAELIKLGVGSAMPATLSTMQVRGRNMKTGLPCTLSIGSMEVYRAIQPQVQAILGCAREVLAATPPELAGDIYEQGIWLTGGGSLLYGIADLFAQATGISSFIAERPLDCVAEGARIAVENIAYYRSRAV